MGTRSTLNRTVTARQEIKKSRFVAVAGPVDDETGAKDFIAAHSDRTANHNCWAWRIGNTFRLSDDGEPSGTAGKPILQAIDGQSLDCVAVLVTRWFGGVLLGSGGLIRAYGGTAAMCLKGAEKIPLIDMVSANVACSFSDLSLVQARLEASPGVQVDAPTFDETGANILVSLPSSDADEIARRIIDQTSGRATIKFDR